MKLVKIDKESGIPLLGAIAFGIIDRGTNLIQVRPTSVCNLCCPFCSVDAGPCSKLHKVNYEVEVGYLLGWVKEVCAFKGPGVEANIDSVGEATCYKNLLGLVKGLKKIKEVSFISMQTNACFLSRNMVDDLVKAGLGRINLSIHALDKDKARLLAGVKEYDVKKIMEIAKYIAGKNIDLILTPVWIRKVNDEDVISIIEFAKSIGARLGIQKYEEYKYSRKMKKAKQMTYFKFYRQLKQWEKEFGVDLVLTRQNMNIVKRKRVPDVFSKGDKVNVKILCEGWIKGQMLGVASDRCVTVNKCLASVGDMVRVKIVEAKNGIYLADVL
ncbi:radical SAM protein [Candidatus Woesearchaeota archaeon]|nr:radical SAM protein [Candidatus Woesearchaeota archaeon]